MLALFWFACRPAQAAEWIFFTYLGGDHIDATSSDFLLRPGMTVDDQGNMYIVGGTRSSNFPVSNAYQATHKWISRYDAYLTKLSPSGALIFSTYFGGTFNDFAHDVAQDRAGNIYVVGETESTDLGATSHAYQGLKYDAQTTPDLSGGGTVDPAFSNRLGTGGLLEYSAPHDASARFIQFIGQ